MFQLKEEYIRFLTAYKPITPPAATRLLEDTPHWQQPELRMALEYMGIPIPPKVLVAPKMTLEMLLGYCEPFEIELKDTEEDQYPHFEAKVNFLISYWHVEVHPHIAISERKPDKRQVGWILQLPNGKLRLCFDHPDTLLPDHIDVDNSSDDLQRVRVYKML